MSSLEIAILNPTVQLRQTTKTLVRNFKESEHEVTLILPVEAHRGSLDANIVDFRTRCVPKIRYPLPSIDFITKIKHLLETVDIIIGIEYDYLPTAVAILLARRNGIPSIVTTDALPGISWKYGNWAVDNIAYIYTQTVGRAIFSVSKKPVGVSSHLEADLHRFVHFGKAEIIPNGIDISRYEVKPSKLVEPLDLLFVGRLDPIKGIDLLLDTAKELHNQRIEFSLKVVGDGRNKNHYEQKARELNIRSQIDFVGWVDDVRPYYYDADITILPSKSEGLPNVVLESQACGVPVVATNVGEIKKAVGAGAIVNSRDPDTLVEAMRSLIQKDGTKLGKYARDHIEKNYNEATAYRRYVELLEELCC